GQDSATDCMKDADGDGYGDESTGEAWDPGTDCDDDSAVAAFRNPGYTAEACDGIDNTCDDTLWSQEIDHDGDGFVECTVTTWLGGTTKQGGDCVDSTSLAYSDQTYPGAAAQ